MWCLWLDVTIAEASVGWWRGFVLVGMLGGGCYSRSLGVRSNRISMKSKHPLESNGRKAPTSGKIDSKSMGTRKQLDRNESGSGRPLGSNGLPLKMSASTTERKTSASGAKTSDDEHDPEAGNVRDVIRKMFR
ncbi:hypothetical protein DVH24_006371 [Malus domestica]|uniref:Uncharacterized protein n=1 Tax=Malus domestica TaxID=3750 RepID=A0A498KFE0_MALDO|nr:hypothetical protein DVH24_006371 [Malus domestica]